jgi:hypothetical protein
MSLWTGCLRLTRLGVNPARRGKGAYTEDGSLDDAFRPASRAPASADVAELGRNALGNRVSASNPI